MLPCMRHVAALDILTLSSKYSVARYRGTEIADLYSPTMRCAHMKGLFVRTGITIKKFGEPNSSPKISP